MRIVSSTVGPVSRAIFPGRGIVLHGFRKGAPQRCSMSRLRIFHRLSAKKVAIKIAGGIGGVCGADHGVENVVRDRDAHQPEWRRSNALPANLVSKGLVRCLDRSGG